MFNKLQIRSKTCSFHYADHVSQGGRGAKEIAYRFPGCDGGNRAPVYHGCRDTHFELNWNDIHLHIYAGDNEEAVLFFRCCFWNSSIAPIALWRKQHRQLHLVKLYNNFLQIAISLMKWRIIIIINSFGGKWKMRRDRGACLRFFFYLFAEQLSVFGWKVDCL